MKDTGNGDLSIWAKDRQTNQQISFGNNKLQKAVKIQICGLSFYLNWSLS